MTATLSTTVLVVAKTVTAVLGTLLTVLALRACRRTGSPALRALAAGIGLVTVGALLGGALHQLVGVSLATGVAVQGVCTALGFAVLTYSVYGAADPVDGETATVADSD